MRKTVILEVIVSDPVESAETPGQFITKLSHPSLTGELVLVHGEDRGPLLNAVGIDPKQIDPVLSMFRGIRQLTER